MRQNITAALALIFSGIEKLKGDFPGRAFTIDGRLVGDIGEVIAELEYDLTLHEVSQPTYDAITADNRNVQIKATFKDSLTFRSRLPSTRARSLLWPPAAVTAFDIVSD